MTDLLPEYLEQPHEVSLETFAKCNAACNFCPYTTLERTGTKMPMETIEKIIDQMAEFKTPFYFSPFKVSDPLLDKRLYSILKSVNEKTLALIRVFTNGSALTLKRAEELNDIDNLELWISLNEYEEDKYKEVVGLDLHRTLKNIDALHETDFRHSVKILKVGKDPEFREFCEDRWPDFEVFFAKKDGWLGFTEAERSEVPDTSCGRWFEMSIMADGIVSFCCMDGKGEYPLGDVNKQSLLEIYNAPLLKERRGQQLSRKQINPCSRCTY